MLYEMVNWPDPTEVLSYWESLNVPPVEVKPYHLGSLERPWVRRENYGTSRIILDNLTNPVCDTAFCLCVKLPLLPPEHTAYFKMYAFCVENDFRHLSYGVFAKVIDLGNWWHPNARCVLPSTIFWYPPYSNLDYQTNEWHEIVDKAAESWRKVADEWVVIRIPDYMEKDSSERKSYDKYMSRKKSLYEEMYALSRCSNCNFNCE